jgi:L-2-hydroxyglutarate oxidase LhgO
VVALEQIEGGWRVVAERAEQQGQESVTCVAVVNAAGLASDRIASLAGMDIDARGYRLHLCKGDYFGLAPGRSVNLSQLIYPLPAGAGLGIHTTLDLAGRLRFGPDAHYVSEPHYDVDPAKASNFAEAIRRYLPDVTPEWLVPDYAGVRTKLSGPGEPFADFVIAEESDAGFPGLVNCIGIESPGLTSSWAIGKRVLGLLQAL